MTITEIGTIKSFIGEEKDDGWGGVTAQIQVLPEYAAGLHGIERFSHLIVVFWMHKASFNAASDLIRRPRGREDMPEIGIFAQRAKHRPNPIGITAVELIGVDKNILEVKGLDAINETPVLDIKPYFPEFDRVSNPQIPEWTARLMQDYF